MAEQALYGERRDIRTKGDINQMRRNEYVPGVIYGMGKDAIPVKLGARQLIRTFNAYGSRGIFTLHIEGDAKPYSVLIREIQRNPVNGQMTHLDFLIIDMKEKLHSSVPIYVTGEEAVTKNGNIVQLGAKEIEVECLPKDLPEYITCDVASLKAGEHITVGDLTLPAAVELLTEPETVAATVLAPRKTAAEDTGETSQGESEAEGLPEEETR